MNQPLEVIDFSGGMTENYLAGPPNCGQLFDNLLINNNRKPFTRFGSVVDDTANGQIPGGVKRIGFMWFQDTQRMEQSERFIYYNNGSYQNLEGPTTNPAFGAGDETNRISRAFWNNHSLLVNDSFCNPIKVYKDGSNVFQVRNAGLPAITAPTVTKGAVGTGSYIYGFLYYYTYNVEGVTFEDFGPTVEVSIDTSVSPDVTPVAITNIPVISNGGTDNWDTSNIKVKIYRTEVDQTVLKFIGQVTNGTTIYNDSASDTSITDNDPIYTTGDVVDNDPPPPAKFVHVANDIALYGYPKEDGVPIPNRVRQSIKGDIDSCPASFFLDFPDTIMGVSSIQGTFIVFCKSSIFRVDNFFDEQGGNGLVSLKISDTVGTVSNDSIVQTDDLLFFASSNGWYFTDGYKVSRISHNLNTTYASLVSTDTKARNIWGAYDKIEKRIWWAVEQSPASLDNDSCFILDLTWPIQDESTFTTASNESSFAPTCLLFSNGTMYRADKRGYVFRHTNGMYTDPRVDISAAPSTWVTKTIIHDYKSCSFNFGTSFVRKFVPKILATFANITDIAVQIYSINDDGRLITALTPIRYNSNITWGDPNITWGDPTILWNKIGLIEEKRMFPAKNLRCNYKQIRMTNAYTVVTNSDFEGVATVDQVAKTITLNDTTFSFPADAVGYFISFEDDSYATQFEILTRNSNTKLTFSDPTNLCPNNGIYKWELQGYRKGESMLILSYVLHYKMLTDSQKSYHTGDSGANS